MMFATLSNADKNNVNGHFFFFDFAYCDSSNHWNARCGVTVKAIVAVESRGVPYSTLHPPTSQSRREEVEDGGLGFPRVHSDGCAAAAELSIQFIELLRHYMPVSGLKFFRPFLRSDSALPNVGCSL